MESGEWRVEGGWCGQCHCEPAEGGRSNLKKRDCFVGTSCLLAMTAIVLLFFVFPLSTFHSPLSVLCWAQESLTVTDLIQTPSPPFSYIRKNPALTTVLPLTVIESAPWEKSSGWVSYNLRGTTSSSAAVVFLSVWAFSEESYTDSNNVGATKGLVSIRQKGANSADWYWECSVGRIYDSDNSIYMDNAHPPYFLFCPINSSQEIEVKYRFWTDSANVKKFSCELSFTVLGYLEGTFKN